MRQYDDDDHRFIPIVNDHLVVSLLTTLSTMMFKVMHRVKIGESRCTVLVVRKRT